jgi:hypothetical protein
MKTAPNPYLDVEPRPEFSGYVEKCLHDPSSKKLCVLGNLLLCSHDSYHECLEAHGNGKRQAKIIEAQPPQPESDTDVTFSIEVATLQLRFLISNDTRESLSLAKLLVQTYDTFFRKKKREFKMYLERTVYYDYAYAMRLIKAYNNPLLIEFWNELGTHKTLLCNRIKDLTPDTIIEIIPMTTREARTFLFPPSVKQPKKTKGNLDELIESLQVFDLVPLNHDDRLRLRTVLRTMLEEVEP